MMQVKTLYPPLPLPADILLPEVSPLSSGLSSSTSNKKKRELREEDKTVHQLRKKFAAMCEDGFSTIKCLNVESVIEDKDGVKLKFAKHSTLAMEDIKVPKIDKTNP